MVHREYIRSVEGRIMSTRIGGGADPVSLGVSAGWRVSCVVEGYNLAAPSLGMAMCCVVFTPYG